MSNEKSTVTMASLTGNQRFTEQRAWNISRSGSRSRNDIAQLNWNLLREDLSLPTAVLYEDRLRHNLEWMQQFITAYGVKLAPMGKTTMAPKLFARQLQTGAWGITLATAHQTHVAYAHGMRRVLMANQLVGKENMAIIARLTAKIPAFEYYCLIDSAALVGPVERIFFAAGHGRLNSLARKLALPRPLVICGDAALQSTAPAPVKLFDHQWFQNPLMKVSEDEAPCAYLPARLPSRTLDAENFDTSVPRYSLRRGSTLV